MNITIGTKVRSFDFEGHELEGKRACYVEGIVTGIKKSEGFCDRYIIAVDRQVFAGKEIEPRMTEVFPPINGTPSLFSGPTNYVVRI